MISGVPQGSVIGPLLFVMFINDMPYEIKSNICKLFVDDCKIYGDVSKADNNTLQTDLTALETWSKIWQLPFNVTKCKVMRFGYHNQRTDYELYNQVLEDTSVEKDLGIMVDNKLNFHAHASAASKKANQILGVIEKAYKSRDQ